MISLFKHFDRKVIILIDEYDVPLSYTSKYGYYDNILIVIRNLLSRCLKDNSQSVKKSVLTGCLRIAKESIFTGLNNLYVNTVLSDMPVLDRAIGFTDNEVKSVLDYYDLTHHYEDVKKWYDGYTFNDAEIYCLWDVVSFVFDLSIKKDKSIFSKKNYWMNVSSNDIIKEFLGFITDEDTDKMQALIAGKTVEMPLNDVLSYDELDKNRPIDFWSQLVFTVYLTAAKQTVKQLDSGLYEVRIPNNEIKDCFKTNVIEYFSSNEKYVNRSEAIATFAMKAEPLSVEDTINEALSEFISIRDTAAKEPKENFYHGFLNGLFSNCKSIIKNYTSNSESGKGYADIMFTSNSGDIGVIIEVKYATAPSELLKKSKEAILQIETNNYKEKFTRQDRMLHIYIYGITFCKKDCAVLLNELDKS